MELIFLGTSGAVPTKKRNLPSFLIEYLNKHHLFDCGEGTQRQMLRGGVNFMRIDHIFLSHLHADHFLGLGGLIQSMNFLEREEDLHIYGPQGTEDTMEHMLSMGTFSLNSFDVKPHEVENGLVMEGERHKVFATENVHTRHSLAYRFEENPKRKFLKEEALKLGIPEGRLFSKLQRGEQVEYKGETFHPDQVLSQPIPGRKVVYSGDTRPYKELIEFSQEADILIHDSTFSQEEEEKAKESGHSTAKEAAKIAKEAGVKKLFLTHISQRYPDASGLQEEAREIFPETYLAKDLKRVKIEKHDI